MVVEMGLDAGAVARVYFEYFETGPLGLADRQNVSVGEERLQDFPHVTENQQATTGFGEDFGGGLEKIRSLVAMPTRHPVGDARRVPRVWFTGDDSITSKVLLVGVNVQTQQHWLPVRSKLTSAC